MTDGTGVVLPWPAILESEEDGSLTRAYPSSKTVLSRLGLISAPASGSDLLVVSRKDVFS
ncbi:hypothetical protein KDA_07390 [Dictyobacter alpinus]|uniref:Uncharacterized protein n=1 Tax=Dictyobacter alpinus TaxID=2014873 RepID=A0A402B1K7_9CHLR|nr:hypothetical protein [Dictyobacter alpinus]GCE25255.1 hypothetical protein KDA_07390 [Dictyobacter alpinus]